MLVNEKVRPIIKYVATFLGSKVRAEAVQAIVAIIARNANARCPSLGFTFLSP